MDIKSMTWLCFTSEKKKRYSFQSVQWGSSSTDQKLNSKKDFWVISLPPLQGFFTPLTQKSDNKIQAE